MSTPDRLQPADPLAVPAAEVARLRLSGRTRVALLTVLLAVAAAVGFVALLRGVDASHASSPLPWPAFAAGFFLAEIKVVEVYFRRERHSFSVSEVPAVLALFFLAPPEYLAAVLAGSGLALLVASDQSPLKIAFNLANYAFSAVITLVLFNALTDANEIPGARDWFALIVTMAIVSATGAVTIAAAIELSGGAPQFQKLPQMLQFAVITSIANTSLALLALTAARNDPGAMVLVAIPVVILFGSYRSYVSEREKNERLNLVYESNRIMTYSSELDSAIVGVLRHARELFRAERAEILLFPRPGAPEALRTSCSVDGSSELMTEVAVDPGDPLIRRIGRERRACFAAAEGGPRQAMASPMLADRGLIGMMRIEHRLTEGSVFTDDDLHLLETLASPVAIALENGQLEQSLAELVRLRDELRHQAFHDHLTGLANRKLFSDEVEERLAGGGQPIVLFLDLDDFKFVNDSHGHAAGDRLLATVAQRLQGVIGDEDVPARLGGDEFAILLAEGSDSDRATEVGRRVIDVLGLPFAVRGQELTVGASIGVAIGKPGDRADDLLREADVAMYTAKSGGKRKLAFFDPGMHAAMIDKHLLATDLVRAVSHREIAVHYQPIVNLSSGRITGIEALARWRHPERGAVSPAEFIRIAEENGAIAALGLDVLGQACRTAALWQREIAGADDLQLHVNVSPSQLREASFVDDVIRTIRETGIRPGTLVVEMTETAMLLDTDATAETFAVLKQNGVRISVDDFGTGYSSLGYLRRFPVDSLKIAAEFVPRESGDEHDDWLVANTIIALGQAMGMDVVAEGIELAGQLDQLRSLGCRLGQGFLLGRPADAASVAAILRAGSVGVAVVAGERPEPARGEVMAAPGPRRW